MEAAQQVARSKRRVVARPAPSPRRVKTAVMLSPEAFRRLGIACVMEAKSQSELVEEALGRHLARYVVSVRGGASGESGDQVDTPDIGN